MPTETALYAALELPPTATQPDIKRAYRRLALQYHPDKNPDGAERFRAVNAAWEVLGDEQMRVVYDKYGMQGVEMTKQMGDMGGVIAANAESMAMAFMCLASILVALISLFPIFIALRGDRTVMWSWAVVFVPVWLVDVLVYVFIVARYFRRHGGKDDNEEDDDHDNQNSDDDSELSPEEAAAKRRERRKRQRQIETLVGTHRFIQWSLLVLLQIFLVLKTDYAVTWRWTTVLAPLFVYEASSFCVKLVRYLVLITTPNIAYVSPLGSVDLAGVKMSAKQRLTVGWQMFYSQLFRVSLAVLIALKADGRLAGTWGAVFTPLYLLFIYELATAIYSFSQSSKTAPAAAGSDDETREMVKHMAMAKSAALVVFGALFFASLGMWIVRLDSAVPHDSYSVGVILIPVFLVLGLVFMCCCCCLPCCFLVSGLAPMGVETAFNPNCPRIEYSDQTSQEQLNRPPA